MTEYTDTVKIWRQRAYILHESDKDDPLSKKIYGHIRNYKDKQSIIMRLTPEERKLMHSLNMAARKEARTDDMHESYYYYSKIKQTFSNTKLSHYYGLDNKLSQERKPQN